MNEIKNETKEDQLTIAAEIKHELDLVLTDEVIAFFSVTIQRRTVADKSPIFPTITEVDKGLNNEEKLYLAHAIIDLGKRIRAAVIMR